MAASDRAFTPGRHGSRPSMSALLVLATALLAFTPACAFSLNQSIAVGDGQTSGAQSTVNGSIEVGRDAVVNGGLETVNGSIRIGDSARIERAETVNGAIRLGDGVTGRDLSSVNGAIQLGSGVTIDGKVSVVNGRIALGEGSRVSGDLDNVNGEIEVEGSEIGGDLSTVNGDVILSGNTVVHGDLVVEAPNDRFWNDKDRRKPKIVVGPGVRVVGRIDLEREVQLYISDSAEVGGVTGVMSLDQAIRFSGERP